jgi:hypothetical protein
MVKPTREFFYGLVLFAVIAVIYAYAGYMSYTPRLTMFGSLLMVIVGSMMVFFGFWGSDYAFSTSLGELNQCKQTGKVKGKKGKVFVPFMGNYTPTEWWNLNWGITTLGTLVLAVGMFLLGTVLGPMLVI